MPVKINTKRTIGTLLASIGGTFANDAFVYSDQQQLILIYCEIVNFLNAFRINRLCGFDVL